MRSPEYVHFLKAVLDAPLGDVARTVRNLFRSREVIPSMFVESAEAAAQADREICQELLNRELARKR